VPIAAGVLVALAAPTPDLLVTGDGRHVALVQSGAAPLMLRERSGDFTRKIVAENAGFDGEPGWIEGDPRAQCTPDACRFEIVRDGRAWRVLAFRSAYFADWRPTIAACADADIVIAERRLPRACTPRWLKLDRTMLEQWGGMAITLGNNPIVETVADREGLHPWAT